MGISYTNVTRSGANLQTGTNAQIGSAPAETNPLALHIEEYGGVVEGTIERKSIIRNFVPIRPVKGTSTISNYQVGESSLSKVTPGTEPDSGLVQFSKVKLTVDTLINARATTFLLDEFQSAYEARAHIGMEHGKKISKFFDQSFFIQALKAAQISDMSGYPPTRKGCQSPPNQRGRPVLHARYPGHHKRRLANGDVEGGTCADGKAGAGIRAGCCFRRRSDVHYRVVTGSARYRDGRGRSGLRIQQYRRPRFEGSYPVLLWAAHFVAHRLPRPPSDCGERCCVHVAYWRLLQLVPSLDADSNAAVGFTMATAWGAMLYYAKVQANTVGMNAQKKQEYLDDNMSGIKLATGVAVMVNMAGLLPDTLDLGHTIFGGQTYGSSSPVAAIGFLQNIGRGAGAAGTTVSGALLGHIPGKADPVDYHKQLRSMWRLVPGSNTVFGTALSNSLATE